MQTVKVKIADLAVLQGGGMLVTVGLGSCVGIALYDNSNKVGGLAHILLADSSHFRHRENAFNPAKFADTALPLLVKKMEEKGIHRGRLKAKIAGGSQLFAAKQNGPGVGEKNIEAVRKVLSELGLALHGEDVGGKHGRTMRLFVDSGKVIISTVGKGEIEL